MMGACPSGKPSLCSPASAKYSLFSKAGHHKCAECAACWTTCIDVTQLASTCSQRTEQLASSTWQATESAVSARTLDACRALDGVYEHAPHEGAQHDAHLASYACVVGAMAACLHADTQALRCRPLDGPLAVLGAFGV